MTLFIQDLVVSAVALGALTVLLGRIRGVVSPRSTSAKRPSCATCGACDRRPQAGQTD